MKGRGALLKASTLAAIITVASIIAYMLGFSLGFRSGIEAGYQKAKEEVYAEAWGSAYLVGYREGNSSGYEEGYRAGYEKGYEEGYAKGVVDGAGETFTLRNPTRREVEDFLEADETDALRWSPEGYSPLEMAAALKNSAAEAGYRCSVAIIQHEAGLAFLNAFDTIDEGLIYVEPWSDRILTLNVGGYYSQWRIQKITLIW